MICKDSIVTMWVSKESTGLNGHLWCCFFITIVLNLLLYSNFLILTEDLPFIAFLSDAVLSGEKQIDFIM